MSRLVMDYKSLEVLELPKVLTQLASYTAFSASRELAMALAPSSDRSEVERWQELTAEGVALLSTRQDFSIRGAEDIRPLAGRAERGGVLEADQLAIIARTIESSQFVKHIVVQLNTDRYPELCAFGSAISPLGDLHRALRSAISDDGQILDSASPELHRLRSEIHTAQLRIQERLQSYLNTHRSALQDAIITMRDHRYVLPVRADARHQLPGIVHDQSASGATVFIEPLAVVELNNAIRTLQIREHHEMERILTELSHQVGHEATTLERNVTVLAAIDLALAKARYAVAHNAVRPILTDEAVIELQDARHPLLHGTVVPLTLSLGREWTQIIITGPNTGGKTVALRTVGLLTIMALSGLHIPAAEGSIIGAIGGVWADIGDEQSIEQSLSTFSSHLTSIIRMLQGVQAGDLVLLDELGAGTDPVEGSALARAILSHLQQRGVLTLATTHYAELKAYAQMTPGIRNASMEFDVETLSPTYRLQMGLPGRSNALAIAARLGLPAAIVQQARALLTPQEREIDSLLAQVLRDRQEAERARSETQRLERQASAMMQQLERERQEWEQERGNRLAALERLAESELEHLRHELNTLHQRAQSLVARQEVERLQKESTAILHEILEQHHQRQPQKPRGDQEHFTPGDFVTIGRLQQAGKILRVDHDHGVGEVQVGNLTIRTRLSDLTKARRSDVVQRDGTSEVWQRRERSVTLPPIPDVPMELDLRGRRVVEVENDLEQFLNDAVRAGLPSARIIHGRGSGAVRQVVHEHLTSHPLVRSFRLGVTGEGGDGVTIVLL